MAKRWIPWLALCAFPLMLLCLVTLPALAQSGSCGGLPNCISDNEFTADTETWFNNFTGTSLQWLSSKSFGWLWWTSSAQGVIEGTYPTDRIYLTPGRYIASTRLATDSSFQYDLRMNGDRVGDVWTVGSSWATYQSYSIYVAQPGYQQFELELADPSLAGGLYVDYFWITADTTFTPSPSPVWTLGPGTPSPTPQPAATATAVAATQLPVPTQVCQSAAPTATPTVVAQYGITPAATATPSWAYYENFDDNLNGTYWAMNNTSYQVAGGRNNSAYSLQLPMSNLPSLPAATLTSQGIVFAPGGTLPATVYVNAWARAQFVPQGITITVDIFKLDGGNWSLVQSVPVSYLDWYPFQVTVSSSSGTAIAFGAHRSDSIEAYDTPVSLDDIYLYTSAGDEPYCDGTIPQSAINIGAADNNPYTTGGTRYFLTVPADRDCPPDILVPNNFWGYLLAGLTRFLDVTMGPWPTHTPGVTATLVANLISSPVITFATLACLFVDLRVPLLCNLAVLTLEGVRSLRSVYMFLKTLLPW